MQSACQLCSVCLSVPPVSYAPLSSPSISQSALSLQRYSFSQQIHPANKQNSTFYSKLKHSVKLLLFLAANLIWKLVPATARRQRTSGKCGFWAVLMLRCETNSDTDYLNHSLNKPQMVCKAPSTCNKPKGKQKWGWHSSHAASRMPVTALGQGNSELMTVLALERLVECTWLQLLSTCEGTAQQTTMRKHILVKIIHFFPTKSSFPTWKHK